MNAFAVVRLVEGHRSEDWCEHHARRMDVYEVLVELDSSVGGSVRYLRRSGRVVRRDTVHGN